MLPRGLTAMWDEVTQVTHGRYKGLCVCPSRLALSWGLPLPGAPKMHQHSPKHPVSQNCPGFPKIVSSRGGIMLI